MIADITVVPIGVGTSLSKYIAEAVKAFKDYKYEVTASGTIVELEDFDELCTILKGIKDNLVNLGVERVVYFIKIDYKLKKDTMERKVKSVLEKLKK